MKKVSINEYIALMNTSDATKNKYFYELENNLKDIKQEREKQWQKKNF